MEKTPKNESGKYGALIQEFKNLEVEWRSLQKSMSRTPIQELVLEKSPRSLMSSLQQSDVAVEEIVNGRRLFRPTVDDEMSVDFDQPCSFSDSSKVVVVEKKKKRKSGDGGGYVVSMAWFAFVLILVSLGLFISINCNGKEDQSEFFLVPT